MGYRGSRPALWGTAIPSQSTQPHVPDQSLRLAGQGFVTVVAPRTAILAENVVVCQTDPQAGFRKV